MKKINLSAKKTIHSFYWNKLKIPKIKKIYNLFKTNLKQFEEKTFSIAVSGGNDSMALVFLSKCLSFDLGYNFVYYHVDHKIRSSSTQEAKQLKNYLRKLDINCKILTVKNKITKNIQSEARQKRYELLIKHSLNEKINNLITAHNKDDVVENFFIRLRRGSGLKGLSSFLNISSNIKKHSNFKIIRPLLNVKKIDLKYVNDNSYNFYIFDKSNEEQKFLRVKIRELIKGLQKEGFSFNNYKLSLDALNKSNEAIEFYVKKNISKNSQYFKHKNLIVLNSNFFNQPDEIIFRSLGSLILLLGKKNSYPRGRKMINLINHLKNFNFVNKLTLSGCIFEKIENSVIIYREI
tara:strand:+ start:674 stop:1720 length:1047 start_codon:yes stop_codon:yes gene_type:complete